MKLVASAFAEHGVSVPLIAVAPYGCVKGREAFDGCKKGSRTYTAVNERATATGAPLNPNHTHFVLVDDGSVAPKAWGKEIPVRAALEATYSNQKAVPMVLLVLQGGPGTLSMVLAYAQNGQAILVVRDSGGAADAVASIVLHGATDDPKFASEASQSTLRQIAALHQASGGALITCFSIHDRVEMSTMLLKALIRNLRPRASRTENATDETSVVSERSVGLGEGSTSEASAPTSFRRPKASREEETIARALVLAVNWNRCDIAEGLLNDMSLQAAAAQATDEDAAQSKFTYSHHVTLQFIIEKQRVELFRLISSCPDFHLAGINLTRLYYNVEDKYALVNADADLRKRMANHLKVISGSDRRRGKDGTPASTYDVYKASVGPFIVSFVPEFAQALEASTAVCFTDLLIWSILIGNDPLMSEFWKRSASPVHTALLGARFARVMTARMPFGVAECLERAEKLESWAVGTLNSVTLQASARAILGRALPDWGSTTLLDLAMQFKMKSFICQWHCQSLMDAWWRGDFPGGRIELPEDYSTLALWLYAVMPPCNPYLYGVGELRSKGNVVVKSFAGSASALLFAKRIARAERLRATGQQSFKQPSVVASSAASGGLGDGSGVGVSPSAKRTLRRFEDMIDVTFQNEEALQAEAAAREVLDNQSRSVSFYSIPATKLVVRFSIHMIFIANYAQVLFNVDPVDHVAEFGVPPVVWHEVILCAWLCGVRSTSTRELGHPSPVAHPPRLSHDSYYGHAMCNTMGLSLLPLSLSVPLTRLSDRVSLVCLSCVSRVSLACVFFAASSRWSPSSLTRRTRSCCSPGVALCSRSPLTSCSSSATSC